MPLLLTEEDVAGLLTPAEAFAAVEASCHRLARGAVDNPPRVRAEVPGGVFAVMPCVDRELGYAGLKSFLWLDAGAPFVVVMFSLAHARIEAVLEAERLGELRTAAASAVAASLLARPAARTLGVFGCGRQAASHVAALRTALPSLEQVLVHCRDAGRRSAFCREHACAEAGTPAEAGACDIVVTATTSTQPVLQGTWLSDGAFVCAVGANDPVARELDDDVVRRAGLVVTDSRTQAMAEAGDLIAAVDEGLVGWADVGVLQDVVSEAPRPDGRGGSITVFKSNGLAAWDLAAAARVVELARAR